MAKYAGRPGFTNKLPDLKLGYDALIDMFSVGKVPRESDYLALMEYINYLHVLLGIEGRDGPELGAGLSVSAGVLSVDAQLDIQVGNGLTLEDDDRISAKGSLTILVLEDSINVAAVVYPYMIYNQYGATFIAEHEEFIFLLSSLNGNVFVRGFARGGAFVREVSGASWTYGGQNPESDFYMDQDNIYLYYKNVALKEGVVIICNVRRANSVVNSHSLSIRRFIGAG